MKRFDQFIKEEIDLKGNKGIPDNLMSDADKQAEKNLGVRKDDERQMMQFGPQIGGLIQRSMRIMSQGLDRNSLEERFVKLETLAKDIIMEEYGDFLSSSEKPIELDIKLLRPGKTINDEISEMDDIPSFPSQEEIVDDDLRKAVDKKKILNVLNQGEAKATKDIIRMSELVKPALEDIFGEKSEEILKIWLDTTEVANKMDWIIPIDSKSQMMKDVPQGMAGACQVKWEKDTTGPDEDDEDGYNEDEEVSFDEDGTQLVGDQNDFDKIVIKAVGIDFPMLIHEAVKGIWSLLKSGSIKGDEEMAKLIAQNTSSFEDEAQDFRYGVPIQAMFRDFINACKDSNKYSNMNARVYAKLALDKDNGGDFEDGEFLEISKSIFSSFKLTEGATLEFILDMGKFNSSMAKKKIEGLISDIVEAEKDYEKQLSEWEMDKKFSYSEQDEEEQDDVDDEEFNDFLSDYGISSKQKEEQKEEQDLSTMKQSDIQELVDDALDRGDYAEVARVSKYLKEGQEIYIKELERINESFIRRQKKK